MILMAKLFKPLWLISLKKIKFKDYNNARALIKIDKGVK